MNDERYKKIGPFRIDRRQVWMFKNIMNIAIFIIACLSVIFLFPKQADLLIPVIIAAANYDLNVRKQEKHEQAIRAAIGSKLDVNQHRKIHESGDV
jgi:hypothetical protein